MLVSDLNHSNGVALPPLDKWKVRQCRDHPLASSLPAVHASEASLVWGSFASGLFYVAAINPQPAYICFFTCFVDWAFFLPHIFYHLGEGETYLED